jgi:C4-dicarboxylate transporter DctM subunit
LNRKATAVSAERRARALFERLENLLASAVLILIALIPTLEVLARKLFKTGIPSSADFVRHLILWIAFLGGTLTSRENRHLTLSAGIDLIKGKANSTIRTATAFIAVSICTAVTWSSLSFLLIAVDPSKRVGFIPIQLVLLIMPAGFLIMGVRFITAAPPGALSRTLAALGLVVGSFLAVSSIVNVLYALFWEIPPFWDVLAELSYSLTGPLVVPMIIVLIVAAMLGTPIFIVLGGIAYLLFIKSWGSLEVIPNEAYTMLTGSTIPAIPLFTLTGFILSESKAGKRLVRLFRAFFGWMPGGLAIMAILVCTFFTTFTGASGVTILALGALLAYVLVESGRFSRRFATGLLTASGSIGLLFPPSLPIILYGVVAQINIKHMFVGGLVPGLLMVLTLSGIGVVFAVKNKVASVPFQPAEAWQAIKESIWEILLPIIILLGFFLGVTSLVETGAVAVIYALVVEVFIHRDIKPRELPGVFMKCIPIIGGVLVILAMARGLSFKIVDAEVPMQLTAWTRANIHSKYLFLFVLNIALLITGCLMDIFSAITVVVPLIIPLGELFGIHPVHLGIIFLANLELGYLTPPVGLNLFLASYRFEQPLVRIYRNVVPYFLALLATVLLITYVPWISTGLLSVVRF